MEFPYRTDFLEVALADHPRAVVERRIAAGEKDGLLALAATGAEGGQLAGIGEKDGLLALAATGAAAACWRRGSPESARLIWRMKGTAVLNRLPAGLHFGKLR